MYHQAGYLSDWSATVVPEAVVAGSGEEQLLSWEATQHLIANWAIPHVESGVAPTPYEAAALASRIGYPVCVKGLVPGVVHKSHAGLVRVGLADEASLLAACREIAAQPSALTAAAPLAFEVQQMVKIERELIVGMTRDAIMGPVITVGAGGTGVERVGDVTCALPPVSEGEVRSLLGRLRIGAELLDQEGRATGPLGAFIALVQAFSEGVVSEGDHLSQVDLNPIVLTAAGAVTAVDAVVSVAVNEGVSP